MFTPQNGRNEFCCAPGNNGKININWMPAFAGMTKTESKGNMFTQTMMQNPGALKVGRYWLLVVLARSIHGARKLKQEE